MVALGAGLGAVISVSPSVAPAAALAVGAAVALVLRRLTKAERFGVATGIGLFSVTGVAILIEGVPPRYDQGIGAAILAALVVGLLGLEIVVRTDDQAALAGEGGLLSQLHADVQVDGWMRFMVWWAIALAVIVHGVVIYVGTIEPVVAITLFPVALAVFAAFPVTASRRHFHADPDQAPLAIVADRVSSIPDAAGSVRNDLWPGRTLRIGQSVRSLSTSTAFGRRGDAEGAPGRRGHGRSRTDDGSRDREASGTDEDADPEPEPSDEPSDEGRDEAGVEAEVSEELPSCQNCGDEGEERESRRITGAYRAVLCRECRAAKAARRTSVDSCRHSIHPVERESVLGAHGGACASCGGSPGELELHPIVPVDGGGHPHPYNVVPLCPTCHGDAH